MPSSYSTSLRFEQQFTGENVNTWGVRLNNMLSRVDDAIAGYVEVTIPASGGYQLTSANDNTTADEARRAHVKLSGSPTTNFNLTIPSVSKSYWILNDTAKVAAVTTGAGDTVLIDAGDAVHCWCDGTNVSQTVFGGLGLKDYIAAAALGTVGDLPAQAGNSGKFVKTNGTLASWQFVMTTDLGDYETLIKGLQVALAVAL